MVSGLSPQNEQYIEHVLAGGLYASREAVIDKAIEVLRKSETHRLALLYEVNLGLAQLDAGLGIDMTPDEWDQIEHEALQQARADRAKAAE